MAPRPGHPPPLLLPRILKLIIHYIHIFVCHLKHIGLPNLEKFVQWPKHFNPPSEKNFWFCPWEQSTCSSRAFIFLHTLQFPCFENFFLCLRMLLQEPVGKRTTLNAPNIQQPMLGVLFKNCLWELWYMYIGLFDIKF